MNTGSYLLNRALNYGDGLFETILVIDAKIPLWPWHYQRLREGLKQLKITLPKEQELLDKIRSLLPESGRYIVKLIVFRDDDKRGYASASHKYQYFISVNKKQKSFLSSELGISPVRLSKQKLLAGLKHLNRLEQVLAAQELKRSNCHDAIMMTQKKHVIETINKNIILFKDNKIYTPKLKNCGVYGVALRWLSAQGFEIKSKKIEFKQLAKYHGMMVCNSITGFNSVTKIAQKIHYPHKNSLAGKISTLWNKRINES